MFPKYKVGDIVKVVRLGRKAPTYWLGAIATVVEVQTHGFVYPITYLIHDDNLNHGGYFLEKELVYANPKDGSFEVDL
jgi:hypothetical protein